MGWRVADISVWVDGAALFATALPAAFACQGRLGAYYRSSSSWGILPINSVLNHLTGQARLGSLYRSRPSWGISPVKPALGTFTRRVCVGAFYRSRLSWGHVAGQVRFGVFYRSTGQGSLGAFYRPSPSWDLLRGGIRVPPLETPKTETWRDGTILDILFYAQQAERTLDGCLCIRSELNGVILNKGGGASLPVWSLYLPISPPAGI